MQTHRTHKNLTHETVEQEAREEVQKQSELKVYIDIIICISNLSGDTWAIAKQLTIWHYPSPIFFNHFSAHLDADNDFAQQIPNPSVIVLTVMQTSL